ncbi:MAG: rhomboid family intramembrane serine protease [Treponema sp.]|nr:rhomboid family intramembrane serine protease [Treponema sp.]
MARKKISLKFEYDAPVTLSFIVITVLIFVISLIAKDAKIQSLLVAPTNAAGKAPFSFSNIKSILGLFLYIFGGADPALLFTNLLFIALIGPSMEERYGSFIIGIMMFVSALFAGVLNACFCKYPMSGCSAVVFMLVLLNAMMYFSKNKITGTSVSMIILFILREVYIKNPNKAVGVIIILAGGLCGSLFAFLASPKARSERKTGVTVEPYKKPKAKKSSSYKSREDRIMEKNKKASASKAKRPAPSSDSDATVVGTLKF